MIETKTRFSINEEYAWDYKKERIKGILKSFNETNMIFSIYRNGGFTNLVVPISLFLNANPELL